VAAPAETQLVKVAWISKGHENLVLEERHVPRTSQIGTAALNELLWGPEPGSAFSTALPTPAEVLGFEGRAAGWGPRVRLLKLTITNGVARANFSPELRAYGGGAARATALRKQIETTLLQFSSVKQVVIAIDGQTDGVLEP
jgi:spore germination protein GerM